MGDMILKVSGITKNFDELKAVDDISFEVYRGEIFGLLGPNGAGKTTMIRMIMGIFEPDSGSIEFNLESGIDKKKTGYLPEERGIYDDTRVLETIVYFAELKGGDRDTAREKAQGWLEKLELTEFASSKIEELSKGMQQKVQFIISVIHNPELLVLDEVFSGLDPVNQEAFKEIIRELAEQGTTILLSSHRMNMVEELCDRIFLINKGQRVLYGELNKIKEEFGERKVRLLVRGDVALFEQLSGITDLVIDGQRVIFSISAEVSPQELLANLPGGLEIDEISITRPPLHDIFVSQIKGGDYSE
jgi:ABC-2 type transport system ATP-binding protein